MRMTLSLSCMALRARVTESLQYWMIYLASWYREWPALVSRRPRWVRTNSCKSRLFSSRLICLITAGGEIYSRSAALLKLPDSTTAKKVSSWGLYMGSHPFPARRGACFIMLVLYPAAGPAATLGTPGFPKRETARQPTGANALFVRERMNLLHKNFRERCCRRGFSSP